MKVKVSKGSKVEEYTIVVLGDTNGDGEAEIRDMVKINNYRLYKTTTNFEGAYQEAGDVNKDGQIDIRDMDELLKLLIEYDQKLKLEKLAQE